MSAAETILMPEKPAQSVDASPPLPLRLTPALVLVGLYWLARVIALTFPALIVLLIVAPLVLALAFFVWQVGFSRLPWGTRGWIALWLVGCGIGIRFLVHSSMSMPLIITGLPTAITAVVMAVVLLQRRPQAVMMAGTALATALGWGYFALLRFDGIDGGMGASMSYRWQPTAEDKFLKELPAKPANVDSADAPALIATDADWPEFRGVNRDSRRTGVRIAPDWKAHPPEQIWRRLIGPGWSSFSVVGDHVFTQDQRGEKEAVVCLSLETGKDYWVHEDTSRFAEDFAGAGPRGTPTYHQGKLYALGGGGKMNCLNAVTGAAIWSRELTKDADAKPPQWGFASSPLVVDGLAIVFAGGKDKGVVAYNADTGEVQWSGGKGTHSYSSPQLWQADKTPQVLVVSDFGLESFEPTTGKLLWSHEWKIQQARVVQPHLAGGSSILLGTGYGEGTRQLTVTGGAEGWAVQEGWTKRDLKPYFNDFVSYEGYLYGFDHEIFCCLNAQTGERKWKKGRYEFGQVLLLSDQGLLIVLSEKGELVLLEANPQKHVELGKFPALKGKTWNHPVVVGDNLLIRNGAEMACYRLAKEGS